MDPTCLIPSFHPNLSSTLVVDKLAGPDFPKKEEYQPDDTYTINQLISILKTSQFPTEQLKRPYEHCLDIMSRWASERRPSGDLWNMTAWVADRQTKRYRKGRVKGITGNGRIAVMLLPDLYHAGPPKRVSLKLPLSTADAELFWLSDTDSIEDWNHGSLRMLLETIDYQTEKLRLSPITVPKDSSSDEASDGTTGWRLAQHMLRKVKISIQPWCAVKDPFSDNDSDQLKARIKIRGKRELSRKLKDKLYSYSSDSDEDFYTNSLYCNGRARLNRNQDTEPDGVLLTTLLSMEKTCSTLERSCPELIERLPDSYDLAETTQLFRSNGITNPTKQQFSIAAMGDTRIANHEAYENMIREIDSCFEVVKLVLLLTTRVSNTKCDKFKF